MLELEDRTVPAPIQVVNTNDTGAGSLRAAITAIDNGTADTAITFLPGLFGTISLGSNLPTITKSVAIEGPGAAVITINGNAANQIFNIDDGAAGALTVSISGLTLTNAKAANGAAVANDADAVTLQDLVISNNTATGQGAGLFTLAGSVNVLNSTFSKNTAPDGAAIRNEGSTMTISDSTLDSNTATNFDGTGGYYQSGGSSVIRDTAVTNNQGGTGAGLYVTGGPTTIADSLIAANKSTNAADSDGGGLDVEGGQVTVQNTTVTGNTANRNGAGVYFNGTVTGSTLTIQNSTIAFNTSDADNTGGGNGGGLFEQGGTLAKLSSDVIAKNATGTTGTNPDVSGAVDATSAFNLIGVSTGLTGITNGLQNNQIGTAGTPLDPQFVSPTPAFNGGTTKTLALQSTSPAVGTGTPNGLTTDQRGNPFVRTNAGSTDIGAFQTQPNQPLVVTTAQDLNDPTYNPADLSLREALRLAGTNAPVITFSPALDGQTISLTLGTLNVDRSVTVQGPGAAQLTVDGQNLFQIFHIDDGSAATLSTVKISGLTLQNGSSTPGTGGTGLGGAILGAENITLDGMVIQNNSAAIAGGGIAQVTGGTLTLTNSWVTGNTTPGEGGGIINVAGSTVKIVNSAITDNTAGTDGGGIASAFGPANLIVQNSTIATNKATADGGGVWVTAGNTFVLDNSTVALNTANADNNAGGGKGGGLFITGLTTPATMQSTIVAKNTLGTNGADPDIDGRIDATRSLVLNTTGWDQSNSDAATLRAVDPLLGPLQNNGGLSPTLALQTGSPAIDAGSNPDAQTTDQRGTGFARVNGTAADVGAFETGNTTTSSVTLTPATLPSAKVGTAYSQTLSATGATGPFTFSITSGTLPAGLTLTPAGVLSGTPTAAGSSTFTVTASNGTATGTQSYTLTVASASSTTTSSVLVGSPQFAVGADAGGSPTVESFNPDQSQALAATSVFGASFTGGVRVASADFNGDGVADIAVGSGPGIPNEVTILDGKTGAVITTFQPFEPTFTGGVFVAAGDLTGDGIPDLVVTPDQTGGPVAAVYDGAKLVAGLATGMPNGQPAQINRFFGIQDPNFRGGARAAIGDINGDGKGDLVVAAGFGGGPRIAGFDGVSVASGAASPTKLFADFFAFEPTLSNGAYVAVGDINGDGHADIITGGGPGGGPRVSVFDGESLMANTPTRTADFFAGDVNNRGGIRVAVKDLDGSNQASLVVGAGTGAGSSVTAYTGKAITANPSSPAPLFNLDAIPGFNGGVYVG
ncbi:beta strand repeat-containing protein [Fimbriiglobus ruber]|uniref:Fibronectin type III domain protein n=1 Tax=Fimbriiglobus ruber TaxID=1908690 RepID=A0A225DQ67_9BACT|nr:choice-of-anchor Q domain-containing protein [Fimbriiglobus ruber]OWK43512.1 Fibronectin type III domain protein [Fimbriiglobus ruber]